MHIYVISKMGAVLHDAYMRHYPNLRCVLTGDTDTIHDAMILVVNMNTIYPCHNIAGSGYGHDLIHNMIMRDYRRQIIFRQWQVTSAKADILLIWYNGINSVQAYIKTQTLFFLMLSENVCFISLCYFLIFRYIFTHTIA